MSTHNALNTKHGNTNNTNNTNNTSNTTNPKYPVRSWRHSPAAAAAWLLALTLVAGAGHAAQNASTTVDAGTAVGTAVSTAVATVGGTAPPAMPDRAALERMALMPTPSRRSRATSPVTTAPQNSRAAAALGLQLPNDLQSPAAATAGKLTPQSSAISAAVNIAVAAADGAGVMTSEVIHSAPASTAPHAQETTAHGAQGTSLQELPVAALPARSAAAPAVPELAPTGSSSAHTAMVPEGIDAQSPMAMLMMSGCALLLLGVLCGLRYVLVPAPSSEGVTEPGLRCAEPFSQAHHTDADHCRQHQFATQTCDSDAE